MADADTPLHIQETPRLKDADFIFDGYTGQEAQAIHDSACQLFIELKLKAASDTIYFVLGSYDSPSSDRSGPKDRVEAVRNTITDSPYNASAILLEELDETNENWANFYLKFRYTLSGSDYSVVVAESNDGGHELELGAVPLATTFILKRNYESLSIDRDLEYEKFDAMMATLCDLMAHKGQLQEWTTVEELLGHTLQIVRDRS